MWLYKSCILSFQSLESNTTRSRFQENEIVVSKLIKNSSNQKYLKQTVYINSLPSNFYMSFHLRNDLDGLSLSGCVIDTLSITVTDEHDLLTSWSTPSNNVNVLMTTSQCSSSSHHKYLAVTFYNHQKIILKLVPHFEVCLDSFEVCTAFQPEFPVFHRSQKNLRGGEKAY